jgi:hypothetical protein
MNKPMIPAHQAVQYNLFDSTMPLRSSEARDDLPSTARELIDVIGLEATIDLVKMFGGDDLKIPEVVNGKSRMWEILAETAGHEAATKLVDRYGGTTIYIPTCRKALLLHRNRDLIRRFDNGEPFDKLRRDAGITKRHLHRILNEPL